MKSNKMKHLNNIGVLPPRKIQVCWVFRSSQTRSRSKHGDAYCFLVLSGRFDLGSSQSALPTNNGSRGTGPFCFHRGTFGPQAASDRYWVSENINPGFKSYYRTKHRNRTCHGAHKTMYPIATGGYFLGDKAAGAWIWLLTSVEFMNAHNYYSTAPYVFMARYLIKHRKNFNFTS
jgi:hypothetical protein